MAVEKLEVETYFGKCNCCLNYGYLRKMWEKSLVEGQAEVYGEMLTKCFSITWKTQSTKHEDHICEDCIWKLREAFLFKKQVLQCQKELEENASEVELKSEPDDEKYIVEYLEEEVLENPERENDERDSQSLKRDSWDDDDDVPFKDDEQDEDYQNESPEDEVSDDATSVVEKVTPRKRALRQKQDSVSDPDAPKLKWPKKLPMQERYKTYKQYTEEALMSAVEAVDSQTMSQRQASSHYQVPLKTLSFKLREAKKNKDIFPASYRRVFVKEVETVLSHVTATPFRSRANNPCCFYCVQRTVFTDPEELRLHTKNTHDLCKQLEVAMRPMFNNEVVKLDLKNVACNICNMALLNWADVVQHLDTAHGKRLEHKNKMMPFVLGDNSCTLCNEEFTSFMLLDAHMNKHYNNYVCDHCGDSFVSANRLKTHVKIHDTGRYPCPICKKVFPLESYMRKHIMHTHTDKLKVRCHYCSEVFKSEYQRQAHIEASHEEHLEQITCELCGMTFTWTRHFLKHMSRSHGKLHRCETCGKFLETRRELKQHADIHKGVKEFKCIVCFKKFYSCSSVQSHIKYSHKKSLGS